MYLSRLWARQQEGSKHLLLLAEELLKSENDFRLILNVPQKNLCVKEGREKGKI